MSFVRTRDHDNVREVAIDRPKANALNEALVDDLAEAIDAARDDAGIRALLLTSAVDGFFSVGFDVREVFDYDRPRMAAYWTRFTDLYETVYHFPKPVVAALPGHTFAGGIILALAADVRLMTEGKFGLGVSGINLGLPLPPGVMNMAVNAIGHGHARRLFITGETIDPQQAYTMGFVHELAAPGALGERALIRARDMADKSPTAFNAVHDMFDTLSGRPGLGSDRDRLDTFLDLWFSDEAELYKARVRAEVVKEA